MKKVKIVNKKKCLKGKTAEQCENGDNLKTMKKLKIVKMHDCYFSVTVNIPQCQTIFKMIFLKYCSY